MRTNRETLAFSLAVGLSIVLHGGFFYSLPGTSAPSRPPTADTVYIDLPPPAPETSPPPFQTPLEPEPPPQALTDPDHPQTASPQSPLAAETPPEAGPPAPGPAVPTPRATTSPSEPKALAPTADESPGERARLRVVPPQPTKSLKDLMPSPRDLARFRSTPPPDPAGGAAREATLGLGETDVRYRSYLEDIQNAIFASWHIGRGLLVAGGPRRVVVRFTVTSLGIAEGASVVEGSGNPTLDAAALEALRRARLSPFPGHWTIEKLHLTAQFDYVFQ